LPLGAASILAAAVTLGPGTGAALAATPVWESLTSPTTETSASLESIAASGGFAVAVGRRRSGPRRGPAGRWPSATTEADGGGSRFPASPGTVT
jgi:hypothetical protein